MNSRHVAALATTVALAGAALQQQPDAVTFPVTKVVEQNYACAEDHAQVTVKRVLGDEGTYVRLVGVGYRGEVDAAYLPTGDTPLLLEDPTQLIEGTGATYRVHLSRLGRDVVVAQLIIYNQCGGAA